MNDIINFLTSNNVVALIILLAVFLLALFFFLRSIVGFIIGLIFLAIAAASGHLLLRNEIIRSYVLREEIKETPKEEKEKTPEQIEQQKKKEDIKDQSVKLYDDVVDWVKHAWENIKSEQKPSDKNQNPENKK